MKTFASLLKEAMTQAGVNQTQLHDITKISKASISQYLSGKNLPGKDKIKLLADALNVSEDFLTGYDVPMVQTDKLAQVAASGVKTPLKITLKEAARCMGKSRQFVREGLKRGILPFGNAVPGSGDNYIYFINPEKFRDYVGENLFTAFFSAATA